MTPGKVKHFFSESSDVAYHREWSIEHHESKCSVLTHSSPEMGSKGQISTLLEYVAYQIEGNEACNNMVVNKLHTDTPSGGVNRNLKVVLLHIKLMGIGRRVP